MNVVWLWLNKEKHEGFWDWAYLEDLFAGNLWKPPGFPTFTHHQGEVPDINGAVVVIPSRNQVEHLDEINKQLAKLDWCLVILTGDEQSVFPWKELKHPNMKIWAMHPHPDIHQGVDRHLINGYPPQAKQLGKIPLNEKPLDVFFAGQINHERREQCADHVEKVPNGKVVRTKGFTQGLPHQEYYQLMSEAKFVPCPAGNHMPDTFRIYEALEAGCIPIADSKPSGKYPGNFWYNLFGSEPPFPVIEEWESVQDVINDWMPRWKQKANEIQSWWAKQKRKAAYDLMQDLYALSGYEPDLSKAITVMMPSSTISRHPSTDMINETIGSIRERLPDAEILVQIDGLRKEQSKRRTEYDEYTRRLIWECQWKHKNVLPVVFDSHHHQALMAKATIDEVKTPYLMYVEQDTPLADEINFDDVLEGLKEYNLVRFSHEAVIPKVHDEMMLDKEPKDGFIRTAQWSGRPHVARTEYYRWVLSLFPWGKKAFIEHRCYGLALEDFNLHGYYGWQKWGLVLYAPDPANLRRSANLNGRANDPVWESEI